MNWLSKIFQSFKNRDPTLYASGEDIGPYRDYGNMQLVEVDGHYELRSDGMEIYDNELARACIHRIASECSKAIPEPLVPNERIRHMIANKPNPYQTTSQFIEQVITITLADNNCFIVPILDRYDIVTGLWAVSPLHAHWTDINGEVYLRYTLPGEAKELLIEHEKVGQLRRMVHNRTLIGESNRPFFDSAKLYETNTQRSINLLNTTKDPIRWKAKMNRTLTSKDMEATKENLSTMNSIAKSTGVLVADMRYDSFEPFTRSISIMKPEDVEQMRKSTYIYWGCSEGILTNKYNEDEWNGFYQSALQPLLNQLSQVLTKVIYSDAQIKRGNGVRFDSDRLQYASIKSRIDVAFGTFDRGMSSANSSLKILNLSPIEDEDGDTRYIRGEYRPTDEPYSEQPQESSSNEERSVSEDERNDSAKSSVLN